MVVKYRDSLSISMILPMEILSEQLHLVFIFAPEFVIYNIIFMEKHKGSDEKTINYLYECLIAQHFSFDIDRKGGRTLGIDIAEVSALFCTGIPFYQVHMIPA